MFGFYQNIKNGVNTTVLIMPICNKGIPVELCLPCSRAVFNILCRTLIKQLYIFTQYYAHFVADNIPSRLVSVWTLSSERVPHYQRKREIEFFQPFYKIVFSQANPRANQQHWSIDSFYLIVDRHRMIWFSTYLIMACCRSAQSIFALTPRRFSRFASHSTLSVSSGS